MNSDTQLGAAGAKSKTEPLPPSNHRHDVHFYESAAELIELVCTYARAGIDANQGLVVLAREATWTSMRHMLQSRAVAVDDLCASGRWIALDADQTLSRFMREGMPEPALFAAAIGEVLQQCAASSSGGVRAFGEMVDILRTQGNMRAALRLEELWHELQRVRPFSLLCAYSERPFHDDFSAILDICDRHTHIVDGVGTSASRANERSSQSIAVRSLLAEVSRRKDSERALRDSLDRLRVAQNQLRSNQEELKDFVDNATVPLHWVGADGTILWTNRAELELFGYDEHEYIGRSIRDFHVDRSAIDDVLARLSRREAFRDCACRLRAKDGSIKDVLVSSSVYERDGEFVHTRCFTFDVTEQRRIEAQRADDVERTERLLTITAAVADAVSEQQVYEAIVDRMTAAIGATTGALWSCEESGTIRLIRSQGYSEEAIARFAALQEGERTPAFDAIQQRKLIWVESQAELLARYPTLATAVTPNRGYQVCCLPLMPGNARCHGALGFTFEHQPIGRDQQHFLTLVARYAAQALERLRLLHAERQNRVDAERAAARAELLYKLARALMNAERVEEVFECGLDAIIDALNTARSSVLVFDADGRMHFKAWRALSDEYRRAVDGHSPWVVDTRDPQPILISDVWNDPAWSDYLPVFKAERIRAIGFIPLVAGGRLIGKFMVYYDNVHSFSATEVELASAIANHFAVAIARFQMITALRESVRFNEMFTGMLGHDLRNPLSAIMTAAQVAMERQPDERIVSPLSRILNSGHRMARMIDQLLDFTRVRVGAGIPLDPQIYDISAGLRQVLEEFEDRRSSSALQWTHQGDLRGTWDGDRLLQVFSNLIANAIQHGTPGRGVRIEADGTQAGSVRIEINNAGEIPAALLPHVFEPMTGDDRRAGRSRGLGLGLFITREIVRAHRGEIIASSSAAEGTTFRIVLPRRKSLGRDSRT